MTARRMIEGMKCEPGATLASAFLLLVLSMGCARNSDAGDFQSATSPGYYPMLGNPDRPEEAEARRRIMAEHAAQTAEIRRKIAEIAAGRMAGGCIGRPREDCVASLAQNVAIASVYDRGGDSLYPLPIQDTDGSTDEVTLYGISPDFRLTAAERDAVRDHDDLGIGTIAFRLWVRAGVVTSLRATLPHSPLHAKRAEDWTRSGLYPALAFLKPDCPSFGPDTMRSWVATEVTSGLAPSPQGGKSVKTRLCGHDVYFGIADLGLGEQAYVEVN